ncbi:hypothetical protein FHX44_114321 [Pseudonocardia hierapolitana]|uniref:Uncharacterized protein n=1 Tax=Pseudonocardia hierapolitana TaxID=1128676 RepID=A0A561SU54_9PSEU|nr:hypothetical protein [Pseudonocardia hierapolitana]TWF78398.1 hypothetical protein FHX44_114321 [Pseudonocardia hierapolitana]
MSPPAGIRAAAFGAHPGAAVRVRPGMSGADRWLVAVTLGGQGRYAAAAAVLDDLLTAPGVPPAVAAHAAVTLAAHRRQLGGHAVARRLDAVGLRLAAAAPPGPPDPDGADASAARIDALTGLAADAVGTGAVGPAQRLLDTAAAAAERRPSWRPAVRLGWVRAELALLRSDAAAAVAPARTALELAEESGSVRHVLKSRIVHAVARGVAGGDPGEVLAELDSAADDAGRAGLLSLVWPARYAAADVIENAPNGVWTANESAARTAQRSVNGRTSGAPRRRHAGTATVSVILGRCDPVGRRLMREALGLPALLPVT